MNESAFMAAWWRGVERAALMAWLQGDGSFEEYALASEQARQWQARG